MGVDADMRWILENLWLTRIFEAEFGFSDVQSNYSRTYAWMANQLGHMTLGMATVFFSSGSPTRLPHLRICS